MITRIKSKRDGELPELPPELLFEIFLRLPVETLLRFRCVCKTWCSIIDSYDFIYSHLKQFNNNKTRSQLLVLESTIAPLHLKYSLAIRDKHTFNLGKQWHVEFQAWSFLGSCNGLLLLLKEINGNKPTQELRLWNPFVRKWLSLPPCPLNNSHRRTRHKFILGFVPCCNEYKVVAFKRVGDYMMPGMAVYSLKNRIWRVKTIDLDDYPSNVLSTVLTRIWWDKFSEGVAYWIVNDHQNCFIVSLDFINEELNRVEMPSSNGSDEMLKYDFVLGESLAVFGISPLRSCIWTLRKDDGGKEQWSLWFSGDFTDAYVYNSFKYLRVKSFSFDENSGTIYILTVNDGLISYNITSHRRQRLGRPYRCYESVTYRIFYVDTYVESLVLSTPSKKPNLLASHGKGVDESDAGSSTNPS